MITKFTAVVSLSMLMVFLAVPVKAQDRDDRDDLYRNDHTFDDVINGRVPTFEDADRYWPKPAESQDACGGGGCCKDGKCEGWNSQTGQNAPMLPTELRSHPSQPWQKDDDANSGSLPGVH